MSIVDILRRSAINLSNAVGKPRSSKGKSMDDGMKIGMKIGGLGLKRSEMIQWGTHS